MAVTRERLLETLENGWGQYLSTYDALAPKVQVEYLNRQGYARFADVLAHVIAWWRDGLTAVEALTVDPEYRAPSRDVDSFNAQAVADFKDMDEAAVRQAFDDTRRQLIDLVTKMPNTDDAPDEIVARLNIEIVGHLHEHSLADY